MLKKLLVKRQRLAGRFPKSARLIKGSLVRLMICCGKPNCRCTKGEKHAALYLSQSHQGKTKMTYIPKRHERTVEEGVRLHRELLTIVKELSECNLKILKCTVRDRTGDGRV